MCDIRSRRARSLREIASFHAKVAHIRQISGDACLIFRPTTALLDNQRHRAAREWRIPQLPDRVASDLRVCLLGDSVPQHLTVEISAHFEDLTEFRVQFREEAIGKWVTDQ